MHVPKYLNYWRWKVTFNEELVKVERLKKKIVQKWQTLLFNHISPNAKHVCFSYNLKEKNIHFHIIQRQLVNFGYIETNAYVYQNDTSC